MAPKYKMTYFDGRGRAEISRLTFTAAGVAFEDVRIGFEDWPKIKPTTPLGSLPMLEVDGKCYAQGLALATFIARETGLYGSNNKDGLVIDMVQQQREDLLVAQSKVMFEKDEAKKAEGMKNLMETAVPKTLDFFCKVLKDNGTGFVVGKKMSLGDLVMYEGTQGLVADGVLDKYPALKDLRSKVEANPKIKAYLSKRKETPF